MTDRTEIVAEIERTGVVAIVRSDSADPLIEIVDALQAGGLTCIEITMTTPGTLEAIAAASQRFAGRCAIGVGTVLDPETARAAILAGATFVVSPIVDEPTIRLCRRYSVASIPGAFTPTEIVRAWQAGADVVKVFPATKLGPSFFKDMRGPLPQIKLTPTGGVSVENAGAFIRAGAVAVGVGSALIGKDAVQAGDFATLTARAKAFLDAVADARDEAG
jgi:2-dehydro-3-deoxyphosphogluconate aldolase/(4S)-4-hydroxy-2-oxoglutarate aldolase